MLNRYARTAAAVLSGVTASLLITATAGEAAQDGPVVVYAEPDANVRTERVSYSDLDLARERDQRKLHLRVAGAVKRVCLFEHGRAGLQDIGYYECATGAKQGAAPQIAAAVERATQLALTGQSTIAAAAITIRVPAS